MSEPLATGEQLSDKEVKQRMRPHFYENFERYYPTETLRELGYERYICDHCGRPFWTQKKRKFCGEPLCSGGYRFIGKKSTQKPLSYRESWETFARELGKHDYTEIRRYPVVCRWYDDLYFTTASINDFQPYVVSGESEPPANPLVVPQFCLRFPDIQEVGMTGRHYTGFIMPGQHAFKGLLSKKEALRHIFDFITKGLGIPPEEVVFHEDIWAGGGNFGPALEYFSKGLELGNQVYMEFQQTKHGFEELDAKVLDHGGGLERYAWFSQGTPTSYEAVFPHVLEKIYSRTGQRPSPKWKKIGRYMAYLEGKNQWGRISEKTGYSMEELKEAIYPMRDIYALADHTRSLLFAITDGALPSNVGGGHNLRNILRRCFHLIEKYDYNLSVVELLQWHIEELGNWFTELRGANSLFDIIKMEKRRYKKSTRKAERLIEKISEPSPEKMLELYDTHGIQPETMEKHGWDVPGDFYDRLDTLHEEQRKTEITEEIEVKDVQETERLYYEDEYQKTFEATVTKILDNWVALNRTIFYPGGGGQEGDKGILNGHDVVDVKESKGVILHKVPDANFEEGNTVEGIIDWETRYALMKNHTATHLINWASRKVLGDHVWQTGAHKSPDKARLDITHYESPSFEELQEIEKLANLKIWEDINVEKTVMPRAKAEQKYGFRLYQGGAVPGKTLRVVKTGEEVEACGGTHLDTTGEVGLIKIINTERIQDGVVRLEYVTDVQALNRFQEHERTLKRLANLWDVPYDQLYATGKRFFNEWKKRGKHIDNLEEQVINLKIKEAMRSSQDLVKVEVPGDFGTIAQQIQRHKSKIENAILLIGKNYGYGIASNEVNIQEVMEELFEKVQGNKNEAKGFKKRS